MADMPAPEENLTRAMTARAMDLANYMRMHGQTIALAHDTHTVLGPVTVLIAIGEDAEAARKVGAEMCARVALANAALNRQAKAN
ncbi:MAG: hypothetical protein WAT39_06985 [Planctomycetota bacterium]